MSRCSARPRGRNRAFGAARATSETFLRRFLGDPKRTGAVAPSEPVSRARDGARRRSRTAPGLVVELGPGTGPVTQGADRARRCGASGCCWSNTIPISATCWPSASRCSGSSAATPMRCAPRSAGGSTQPVAAVVSSLPLLNEPPARRLRLLDEAFELMGPDGVFVQFTYRPRARRSRARPAPANMSARCGAPILRNLPPASVWTYRRRGPGPSPEAKIMQADRPRRTARRASWPRSRKATEDDAGPPGRPGEGDAEARGRGVRANAFRPGGRP